jgi:hypothetical protein
MRANDAGIMSAAAEPWTKRAPTSAPRLGARPHATDATTNRPIPAAKVRRAPIRSDSAPDHSSSAANMRV